MRWWAFLLLVGAFKWVGTSPVRAGESIYIAQHPLAGVFFCAQTEEAFWITIRVEGIEVWYHNSADSTTDEWLKCVILKSDSLSVSVSLPNAHHVVRLQTSDTLANAIGMCLDVSHEMRRIHNHQPVMINVGSACRLAMNPPQNLTEAKAIFDEWQTSHLVDARGLAQPFPTQTIQYDVGKPVLYLYPAVPTDIDVQLVLSPETPPLCYPPLDSTQHWHVAAQPDGRLTDRTTGTVYPNLFWEAPLDHSFPPEVFYYGWWVGQADLAPFLETRLTEMNFTPAERTEFIQYWLPRMARYPYVHVHFATIGSDSARTNDTGRHYAQHAPLTISPAPENALRVLMVWHPMEAYHLRATRPGPQTLPRLNRTGYHALEWGGMERFAFPDFRHATQR